MTAPRKVLLLTYHFPPSGAVAVHRMLGLVRYLPKFGWQPMVVAPPRVPWEPEDVSLLEQVPPGTVVSRVPFASSGLGKLVRYFAPESHWLWAASRECDRLIRENRPDAVITSSPPGCVHMLGRRVQRNFGLRWIADFRDPWAANQTLERGPIRRRWERCLEGKVMRDADVLVANTPLNQRGWADAYPEAAHKMMTIPNGFDPERFAVSSERPARDRLTILHAGELYGGRDPRPLLEAIKQMPADRNSLRVEFLGRKTERTVNLPEEIKRRGLEGCVQLDDQVPYPEAIERMMHADILLLIHAPGLRVSVPAKLYEYLGAGRPILALAELDSDIAWVLRESGAPHRIAPPLDVPAIKIALAELTREVWSGVSKNANQEMLHKFTREQMARSFAEALDRCMGAA